MGNTCKLKLFFSNLLESNICSPLSSQNASMIESFNTPSSIQSDQLPQKVHKLPLPSLDDGDRRSNEILEIEENEKDFDLFISEEFEVNEESVDKKIEVLESDDKLDVQENKVEDSELIEPEVSVEEVVFEEKKDQIISHKKKENIKKSNKNEFTLKEILNIPVLPPLPKVPTFSTDPSERKINYLTYESNLQFFR